MLIRDSGVASLFAENAQEAYDLTVMAPKVAEHPDAPAGPRLQDGFTITHSAEPVALLEDDEVVRFLGDYSVPHVLDTSRPTTQGPFAMPDYYFELRRQQAGPRAALDAFTEVAAEYGGSPSGTAACSRLTGSRGAERAIVALGSSAGTIKDVVDDLRAEGEPVRDAQDRLVPAVPCSARGGASGSELRDRARPRRFSGRRSAAPRRGGRVALQVGDRPPRPYTASAGATCTRRTSPRSSRDASRCVGLRGVTCPA